MSHVSMSRHFEHILKARYRSMCLINKIKIIFSKQFNLKKLLTKYIYIINSQ